MGSWEFLDLRDLEQERAELRDLPPDDLTNQDADRLNAIDALADQLGTDDLEEYANDVDPTLIHEAYFEEYARELAYDIGAISGDEGWPLYCIDWGRAVRELRMDYTTVDFDGDTYYIRA